MKTASYIKRHPILFSLVVFMFVVASAYNVKVKNTEGALGLHFGGRIVWAMPCFCSFTMWLLVINIGSPQFNGAYLYTFFTIPHIWYQFFRPGPYILGWYIPSGGQGCWVYVPPWFCVPWGTTGIIMEAGTSL
jgi:hypothetical protein